MNIVWNIVRRVGQWAMMMSEIRPQKSANQIYGILEILTLVTMKIIVV
jgi:hypothetical protein